MVPDSSDSPKSCLHTLDNKIKLLEESTHALKRYRNTFVPILSLPTEILSIIFSLLPSFGILDPSLPIAPTPISHVCHRWRDISLNMPYLWSHINFTKLTPAGTAEMLARAKMAPLHLEAKTSQWSMEKFEAFKRQVKAHIHHTRQLSIMATPQYLMQMFRRLVSSAPSLEKFSIAKFSQSNSPLTIRSIFSMESPPNSHTFGLTTAESVGSHHSSRACGTSNYFHFLPAHELQSMLG
jgi:hypothetical protein